MSTFIKKREMQNFKQHIQQLLSKQTTLKQEIRFLKQDISDDEDDLNELRQEYLEAKEKSEREQMELIEQKGKDLKIQIGEDMKKKAELLKELHEVSQELEQAQKIENHNLYEEIKKNA